jgi:Phosphatase
VDPEPEQDSELLSADIGQPAPTRERLRRHLLAARLAGDVATSRASNLGNARRCADRDEHFTFGLDWDGSWDYPRIVALMADRVGIDPDLTRTNGTDRIDAERTLDALDRVREQLRRVVADRGCVLLASGHPSGMIAVALQLAPALAARGCTIATPACGFSYSSSAGHREVAYLAGVACLTDGSWLEHTHSATPMRAMLTALDEERRPLPDLVVADHGFAGAAGQAGITTVAFADCNDPGLFVGEAEQLVDVVVPIDDNVAPHLYAPVAAYLLDGIR